VHTGETYTYGDLRATITTRYSVAIWTIGDRQIRRMVRMPAVNITYGDCGAEDSRLLLIYRGGNGDRGGEMFCRKIEMGCAWY
jgi:hypothetical protein